MIDALYIDHLENKFKENKLNLIIVKNDEHTPRKAHYNTSYGQLGIVLKLPKYKLRGRHDLDIDLR